jgi:hypothetical protein
MSEWSPEADPDHADDAAAPVARVVTAHGVRIRLVPREDDRAPAGSVVFRAHGTLAGDGLAVEPGGDAPVLAQGSLPVAVFNAIGAAKVFANPVPLLLEVRPDGGGLAGVLYALVPQPALERLDRVARAADEPWLASVDVAASDPGASSDEATPHLPFALGAIVRFAEDRRYPASLAEEAVDLLASLLVGRAMDADQKRIERLLNSL